MDNYINYRDIMSHIRKLFKHLIQYKYDIYHQSILLINTIDDDMVNLQNDLYYNNDELRTRIYNDIDYWYELGVKDAAREIGLDYKEIEEKENKDLPFNIDELIDEKVIYNFMAKNAISMDAKGELKKRGYIKIKED